MLAVALIREYGKRDKLQQAEAVLDTFAAHGPQSALAHVGNTLADLLREVGEEDKARQLLREHAALLFKQDAVDAAILARRLRDPQTAHQHFQRTGDAIDADPRALLEFAQTKMDLAGSAYRERKPDLNRRFLGEAQPLLERVLRMDAAPTRHAWAWRELARTRRWLGAPARDVEDAYNKAIALLPQESRFVDELQQFAERRQQRRPR